MFTQYRNMHALHFRPPAPLKKVHTWACRFNVFLATHNRPVSHTTQRQSIRRTFNSAASQVTVATAQELSNSKTSAPDDANYPKRNICIAIDSTDNSVSALQWALDNLISPNDVVHLVHVISDPRAPLMQVGATGTGVQWSPSPTSRESPQLAMEWRKRLEEQGKQLLLTTFVPMLRNAKISNEVEVLQQRGAKSAAGIGELLCSKAAAIKADLLLVASHGSGVLADYGSVAQYCAKNTPCPLLLLPPQLGPVSEGAAVDVLIAAWDDMGGLEQVTRLAVEMLHFKDQKLKLVLIDDNANHADDDSGTSSESAFHKQLQAAASSWVPSTALTCEVLANISAPELDSDHSLVGERIVKGASESGARIAVLKNIKSNLIQELVHGPALSYVFRHCKLPVVLVP